MNFYIVDVFAESKYAGNQLAVFTGEDVANLSDTEMLQIAKEINYSETTFVLSTQPKNGGYDVRIFTPKKELPFAGHPTLGTAYVIQTQIIQQSVEQVILNLTVGQIPVTFKSEKNLGEIVWMRQNSPTFEQVLSAESVAPLLGLDVSEIDSRFPIQEVSTGIPFILVPLKTLASLKKAKVNLEPYFNFISTTNAQEIFIFCPETYQAGNDLSARMFAPALGITEDAATGSANGCLAAYLVQYTYFGAAQIETRVEQGYEIGRPSLLLLKAKKNQDAIEIFVGGQVVMVAQGKFV